jgi:hypothetical protein
LVKFLDEQIARETEDSEYAIAVEMVVSFAKKAGKTPLHVYLTNDPTAPAVRLLEDDIRSRYPLDYRSLLKRVKAQDPTLKINSKFNQTMRELQQDPKLCHTRLLDPTRPARGSMRFYSEAILPRIKSAFDIP